MATLAHPAEGEFGSRSDTAASMRRVLERAVDAAPSHIRPLRGLLRRLFARDQSARALIERYRLWPAIEHACERITREYGPMRVEISALDTRDDLVVEVRFYGDVTISDDLFEFESAIFHENLRLLPGDRYRHLWLGIWPEPGHRDYEF